MPLHSVDWEGEPVVPPINRSGISSCPNVVHKTWRHFVQPINVDFLLNFREITYQIWTSFITWQLINIHDWAWCALIRCREQSSDPEIPSAPFGDHVINPNVVELTSLSLDLLGNHVVIACIWWPYGRGRGRKSTVNYNNECKYVVKSSNA